jgi:dipeptidyl aminopeptidase/acylaminoacyl peptidase
MQLKKFFVPMIILVFSLSGLAEQKENKAPSFEDILSLQMPGSPIISPDGLFILFTVRETDWDNNKYLNQIWMVDSAAGKKRQMTFDEKGSISPKWTPDGKNFTFLSSRDEKAKLYIMSAFGGEARVLVEPEAGMGRYEWSPDGGQIAFTGGKEKNTEETERAEKYGKFQVAGSVTSNVLWLFDVKEKALKKLVDENNLHITSFKWSPDGNEIAFSAAPDSSPNSSLKSDVYVVNVSDGSRRKIVDRPGPDNYPVWSPDGKKIAFSSKMGKEDFFSNSHICVVSSEGGEISALTSRFDENASPQLWNHNGIYFRSYQGMSVHLFRINREKSAITRISRGEHLLMSGVSFSADGKRMALQYSDPDHFAEIYVSDTDKFDPRPVTEFSAQLEGWKMSRKETVTWKSRDGTEISGVLIKPADFDPTKKYPLLVILHGGPTSVSFPTLYDYQSIDYPIEQWSAKGAVILEPNYRGSAGFGEKFRKLNYRNLGVGDYWDVLSGVEHLIDRGFIDPEKLGAMGWSQGGYISAFIATYSRKFRAVSVGAGISDWTTYYVNTDIQPFTRVYLGATPWDDEEIYKKTSPITYVKQAQTPTLIQHGEFDRRVPIPNAYKLYQALKDKGVPVKFIIYKGFGHGVTKPKENLAVCTHNFHWFNQFIWEEPPPAEDIIW